MVDLEPWKGWKGCLRCHKIGYFEKNDLTSHSWCSDSLVCEEHNHMKERPNI
jgi:hypothetical protein